MRNPYQNYKEQSILTMTPGNLLITLYDEVLKELSTAKVALESEDYNRTNKALQKSQRILNHLKATLNFDYSVSENLDALYDYFISRIIQANIKKDPAVLDEIIPMVSDLRDTYSQADRLSRTQDK